MNNGREDMINDIIVGVLHKMYKQSIETNPDLNKKIEAYIASSNIPHCENGCIARLQPPRLPTILISSQTEDISMMYKVAAERVATGLGLNLVIDPADGTQINANDFVYYSQNCSPIDTKSNNPLATPDIETDVEYFVQTVNKKLSYVKNAAGGLIEMTDWAQGGATVKNVVASVADPHRLKELDCKNVYFGYSGKLEPDEFNKIPSYMIPRHNLYYGPVLYLPERVRSFAKNKGPN